MIFYYQTIVVSFFFLLFHGERNFIRAKVTDEGTSTTKSRKEFTCSGRYLNHPYCRYTKGDCQSRIVINAPHGGTLEPPDVPPRLGGCLVDGKCEWTYFCHPKNVTKCEGIIVNKNDDHTTEISDEIVAELTKLSGVRPYYSRNHLHRSRIDANREIHQSTFDYPSMIKAYKEYHGFINKACKSIQGPGVFFEIHGHSAQSYKNPYILLGYNIKKKEFANETLSNSETCSLKNLIARSDYSMDSLIRGDESLGYFIAKNGFTRVMPSPGVPDPGFIGGYYRGGDNIRKYGPIDGDSQLDSIQIEIHKSYNKDITKIAKAIARSIYEWSKLHYGTLPRQRCNDE